MVCAVTGKLRAFVQFHFQKGNVYSILLHVRESDILKVGTKLRRK